MFKIRISDAKSFKSVMDAISAVVDEATFIVGPDGIRLRAMDPSRVAMVDWEMQRTSFDEYEADEESKVCINLSEFKKVLKRASKDDVIELSLEKGSNQLGVKIRGRYTRSFTLPILEISEEEVPEPRLTFNVKATLTANDFYDTLKDAELVSDNVRIEADEKGLVMNAKGDVAGTRIEMEKGSDALLSIEVKEPSEATFSLSYLTDIVKAASDTSDIVTLEFSTDMPLRLDFRQRYDGKLVYLLAPRVEVE
ncbi:MAG: proliferating cell nuclear antigen (pcna) [Candidatus Bathyarchaeia archaeon]